MYVDDLMRFIDKALGDAKAQGRDEFLSNARWGNRDTSQNWRNHAWGFIEDYRQRIERQIAQRSADIYSYTDINFCARGLAEYSMQWATLEEENEFHTKFEAITAYASNIDTTLKKTHPKSGWDDFCLHAASLEFGIFNTPFLTVRTDITARSGEIPPKTGVYVSLTDPDATPQFAWTGPPGGELLDAATFNELGRAALNEVGHENLWRDENMMFDFLKKHAHDAALKADSFYEWSIKKPNLAPSLIARHAFHYIPTEWALVEII